MGLTRRTSATSPIWWSAARRIRWTLGTGVPDDDAVARGADPRAPPPGGRAPHPGPRPDERRVDEDPLGALHGLDADPVRCDHAGPYRAVHMADRGQLERPAGGGQEREGRHRSRRL